MVGSLIQQIPFGRADLPDCPVISTHIIFRGKAAAAVCGIGVDQRIPVINPVHCACQRSVSLRDSCLPVCLCDRYPELFQYVMDGGIGHFVPVDGHVLGRRNHIPVCCLHFLQRIGRIAGDQNIRKHGNTCAVRNRILIHRNTGKRGSVEMELHAFHQTVLRSLGHFQISTLEDIGKVHRSGFPAFDLHCLRFLWFIAVLCQLCYRVGSRLKVLHLDRSILPGGNSLVNPVARDLEFQSDHHTVLGSFHDLDMPIRDFHIQICSYRCGILHTCDNILQRRISICNQLGAAAHCGDLLGCG